QQAERLRVYCKLRCAKICAEILVKFLIEVPGDLGDERRGNAFRFAVNNDIGVRWRRAEDTAQACGCGDLRVERHSADKRDGSNHADGCHKEQAPCLAQTPESQCYGWRYQGPSTPGRAKALELSVQTVVRFFH